MAKLGRPTIKSGPHYGEWHYTPEFPAGWVLAERIPYGWSVRLREGAKPERKVEVKDSEFGSRPNTLRTAGDIAIEKASSLFNFKTNPEGTLDYVDAFRKGAKRLGRLRTLVGTGAKAATHSGVKAVPGAGELMMLVDAAPEIKRAQKAMSANARQSYEDTKKAQGIVGKVRSMGRGAAKQIELKLSSTARIGAAALVGSEITQKALSNPRRSPKSYRDEIAKMLSDMPVGWRQQYNSGRNELASIGGGTLPNYPTPEQAMKLIGITAGGNASNDQPTGPNIVPDKVREEAMQGLRLSYKNNYGAWNFIGIARAIQLAIAPGVSDKTRSRMRAYFRRHVKDAQSSHWEDTKHPSKGWMAWLNWGGDAGHAWVTEAKSNPWTEDKLPRCAPCRRCGGTGKLPSFPHVERGVCFKCQGTGLVDADWRVSEPERFKLFNVPVRVYTIKGGMKILVKEADFIRDGTPMLDVNNRNCSVFILRNGHVVGWSGGQEMAYVSPPLSALNLSMPGWIDLAYPDMDYGISLQQVQKRRKAFELAEKLGIQIKQALESHYKEQK